MTQVVVFHSVLGLRPGVAAAAERLRAAGHEVLVVDQYDGRVFDDYDEADAFAQTLGYSELMRRAVAAVEPLPDRFVVAGFSNGGAMAEHVATQRPVAGVLMLSGALPLEMLGADAWPAGVPAQIHYARDDPYRRQQWVDAVASSVRDAGGPGHPVPQGIASWDPRRGGSGTLCGHGPRLFPSPVDGRLAGCWRPARRLDQCWRTS